jgi:hypothetical protein
VKKTAPFILLLAFLSTISGYLLSKASLVGRAGISLFYKKYKFLKIWWQGALAVFIVLMLLMLLQGMANQKLSFNKAMLIQIIMLLLALTGAYFTFQDFRHTLSHRLLGERFHIGAYLFWVDWILICLFFLAPKKKEITKP